MMKRLVLLLVVVAPLLTACETTDWFADTSDASSQDTATYSPNFDANAADEQFWAHQRAVQEENCAAAMQGRDRVCDR